MEIHVRIRDCDKSNDQLLNSVFCVEPTGKSLQHVAIYAFSSSGHRKAKFIFLQMQEDGVSGGHGPIALLEQRTGTGQDNALTQHHSLGGQTALEQTRRRNLVQVKISLSYYT